MSKLNISEQQNNLNTQGMDKKLANGKKNSNIQEDKLVQDPVSIATGAFIVKNSDMAVKDILENFVFVRRYNSVQEKENRMFGSKWITNVESYIESINNQVQVLIEDMHVERFNIKKDVFSANPKVTFENEKQGLLRYDLKKMGEEYILYNQKNRKKYIYNNKGKITKIIDSNSNTTQYIYDNSNLVKIDFTSGFCLKFEYADNKVCCIEDSAGRRFLYEYDNNDYLTKVSYPNGTSFCYEYSNEGYITSLTDRKGVTYLRNEYDAKGRVLKQHQSNGEEIVYSYNDVSKRNSVTLKSKNVTTYYTYDKENRVTKTEFADGTTEEAKFDVYDNKISVTDRKGRKHLDIYDKKGLIAEKMYQNGLIIKHKYNEHDLLIEKTDNTKRAEYWKYDNYGNVLEYKKLIQDGMYKTTTYTYDSYGRKLSEEDGMGGKVEYIYETKFAEPSILKGVDGQVITRSYDKLGNVLEETQGTQKRINEYDILNQLISVTDAKGRKVTYTYDADGNIIEETNKKGQKSTYEYNTSDELIKIKRPTGAVIRLEKNESDKLSKIINPNTYGKDEKGVIYEYDMDDNIIKEIYPDGSILRKYYDELGNVIKEIPPENYNEVTDDGEGFIYEYDKQNHLVKVTNPYGVQERAYTYDRVGQLIREDRLKNHVLYSYNQAGLLIEQREQIGEDEYRLTKYEHDSEEILQKEIRYLEKQTKESAIGHVRIVTTKRDKSGRIIEISDTTGAQIRYEYNTENQRIAEYRKINSTVTAIKRYTYDETGNITTIEENEATTKLIYDENDNIVKIITPTGNIIQRNYDADGHISEEYHLENNGDIQNHIRYKYDYAGNMILQENLNGGKIYYEYDLNNRQIKKTDVNGAVTYRVYNKNNDIIKEIRPSEYALCKEDGKGYQYSYDKMGRLLKIVKPDGNIDREAMYNQYGELETITDAVGSGVSCIYDILGRRTSITTKENVTQNITYDIWDNITKTDNTTYKLDEWGRITKLVTAEGIEEEYLYDYAGNIVKAVNGEKQTLSYNYNSINKLSEVVFQDGKKESYTYDNEGRLKEQKDRNGNTIIYKYNMYDNLVQKKDVSTGLENKYGYDKEGKLRYAENNGIRYDYEYNDIGELVRKTSSGRTLLSYTYHKNGKIDTLTDVTGKTTKYSYNILDQLTQVTDNGQIQALYTYYLDGTKKTVQAGANLITAYAYDKDKNVVQLASKLGENYIVNNIYTYDNRGNCTKKKMLESTQLYAYDKDDRLVQTRYTDVNKKYDYGENFAYDKANNRIQRIKQDVNTCKKTGEVYTYNINNQLVKLTTFGIKENKIEENTKKSLYYTYDKNGNMLTEEQTKFNYNAFNQMVKAEVPTFDTGIDISLDIASSTNISSINMTNTNMQTSSVCEDTQSVQSKQINIQVQVNRYDAEGLRYEVEENEKLVKYIYNAQKIVTEEKAEQAHIRYIRGLELISSDNEQAKTYYHYASDERGSITQITKEKTILNSYVYEAFGNILEQKEQVENRFKYTGEQYDSITNQYYLRARYYNIIIGRFIQQDTYHGDGLNLYTYVANNPNKYADPSGNSKCPNKYPERTSAAKNECKKIIAMRNKIKGDDTSNPVISCFLHEDGTVSVGISARMKYKKDGTIDMDNHRKYARKLQDELNEDAIKNGWEKEKYKYRVAAIVDDELLQNMEDSKKIVVMSNQNPKGQCAEPKAATVAHYNSSPIVGMDTRFYSAEKNQYKIDQKDPRQMRPCKVCETFEEEYMNYANSYEILSDDMFNKIYNWE